MTPFIVVAPSAPTPFDVKVIPSRIVEALRADRPVVVTSPSNFTVPDEATCVKPVTLTVDPNVLVPDSSNFKICVPATAPNTLYSPAPSRVTSPLEIVTPFIVVNPPAVKTIPSKPVEAPRVDTPVVVTFCWKVTVPEPAIWLNPANPVPPPTIPAKVLVPAPCNPRVKVAPLRVLVTS